MPPFNSALQGLKRYMPGSGVYDPSGNVDLMSLQQGRASEAEDNLANAADPNDMRRFSQILNGLRGDISENPITKQQGYADQTEAANQEAMRSGFGGNPDAPSAKAGAFARMLEQKKMEIPLRQEEIQGKFGNERQSLANQGTSDVAHIYTDSAKDQLQSQLDAAGNRPISRMSTTRGGASVSYAPEAKTSAVLQNSLAKARGAYAQKGDDGSKAALDSLVASVFENDPAPEQVKLTAREIFLDPEDANEPINNITSRIHNPDGSPLDPTTSMHLRRLLATLRGKDF